MRTEKYEIWYSQNLYIGGGQKAKNTSTTMHVKMSRNIILQ